MTAGITRLHALLDGPVRTAECDVCESDPPGYVTACGCITSATGKHIKGGGVWVEPRIVASLAYYGWTSRTGMVAYAGDRMLVAMERAYPR